MADILILIINERANVAEYRMGWIIPKFANFSNFDNFPNLKENLNFKYI